MSLRWIHENLEPPNCDEESSDIDDSCSDDSYDSDVVLGGSGAGCSVGGSCEDDGSYSNNNNSTSKNNNITGSKGPEREKRESTRHPDTIVTVHRLG
jgi:hypothetical protein